VAALGTVASPKSAASNTGIDVLRFITLSFRVQYYHTPLSIAVIDSPMIDSPMPPSMNARISWEKGKRGQPEISRFSLP
jgi:hypothetical protein